MTREDIEFTVSTALWTTLKFVAKITFLIIMLWFLIVAGIVVLSISTAEAKPFVLGNTYEIQLGEDCNQTNNFQIGCGLVGEETALYSWGIIEKNDNLTQEKLAEIANDPKKRKRAIEIFTGVFTKDLKDANIKCVKGPYVDIVKFGDVWTLHGICKDGSAVFGRTQIWFLGMAGNFSAIFGDTPDNMQVFNNQLDSIKLVGQGGG